MRHGLQLAFVLVALALLTGCADDTPAQPSQRPELRALFDCLMAHDEAVVAAHRGGPAPGYPENALETLARTRKAGVAVFEIDVAQTRGGALILMHDEDLARTTTGAGAVADAAYAEISELFLQGPEGRVTPYRVPTLEAALDWAKETGAVLELDPRRGIDLDRMVDAVQTADAQTRVIYIAHNPNEALALHGLAPDALISYGVNSMEDLSAALTAGLPKSVLLAWTGTREIRPDFYAALEAKGVPSLFGTLGWGDSFDVRFAEDDDFSEYRELAAMGVVLISTDAPKDAHDALYGARGPSCHSAL